MDAKKRAEILEINPAVDAELLKSYERLSGRSENRSKPTGLGISAPFDAVKSVQPQIQEVFSQVNEKKK